MIVQLHQRYECKWCGRVFFVEPEDVNRIGNIDLCTLCEKKIWGKKPENDDRKI